jgi:hypothetical protein
MKVRSAASRPLSKGVTARMKTLLLIVFWCLLWVLCWPIALAALVLWPILWLLSIPFRIVGIVLESMLAFLKALLTLPARILGGGGASARRSP